MTMTPAIAPSRRPIAADLDDYLWREVAPRLSSGGFEWTWHCGRLAAGWILRREGGDPLAGVARVETPRDALAVIARHGGTLPAATTELLRRHPVRASMAQPGDIVHLSGTRGVGGALGICAGRLSWMLGGVSLTSVETLSCDLAWRVA